MNKRLALEVIVSAILTALYHWIEKAIDDHFEKKRERRQKDKEED